MNSKLLPIDLMIFDFDGTLADSIPAAVESIQFMLKELDFPFKTAEEINVHVGFGEVPLVSGSIDSDDPAKVQKAMDVYFDHYRREGIDKILVYPGVRDALEYFKDKRKIIVSNKNDGLIKIILQRQGLDKFFSHVFGGESAPCLKPDPRLIKQLLEQYKLSPKQALFIGDMTVDIETGQNAGTYTCAVTYGFHPRHLLENARPDFLVGNLLELKNLIC